MFRCLIHLLEELSSCNALIGKTARKRVHSPFLIHTKSTISIFHFAFIFGAQAGSKILDCMVVLRKRTRPQRALSAARLVEELHWDTDALCGRARHLLTSLPLQGLAMCVAQKVPQKYKQTNRQKYKTHQLIIFWIQHSQIQNTRSARWKDLSRGLGLSPLQGLGCMLRPALAGRDVAQSQIPNTLRNNSQKETQIQIQGVF